MLHNSLTRVYYQSYAFRLGSGAWANISLVVQQLHSGVKQSRLRLAQRAIRPFVELSKLLLYSDIHHVTYLYSFGGKLAVIFGDSSYAVIAC